MKIWSEYKSRGGVNSIKKASPYGESLVSHGGLGLWPRKQALLFSERSEIKTKDKTLQTAFKYNSYLIFMLIMTLRQNKHCYSHVGLGNADIYHLSCQPSA